MERKLVVPWAQFSLGTFSEYDENGTKEFLGVMFKTPSGDMVFPIQDVPVPPEYETKLRAAFHSLTEAIRLVQGSQTA